MTDDTYNTRLHLIIAQIEMSFADKGRVQKKKNAAKVWSFTKPGGGGAPRIIKNQTPFLEKYFFSELVESF